MNKSMITGALAGAGIAIAGGVAGLTLLQESPSATGEIAAIVEPEPSTSTAPVPAAPAPRQAPAASAPAPRQAPAPAPRTVAAVQTPAPQPVAEECWDEEVVVQAEPRDDKRIAGTAAGALIGGALADRIGDDDDLVTAAGAAAGAFIGRRAQREYQENQTTVVTERRCAPVQ
jgi:uncharacterized protein YcfJ